MSSAVAVTGSEGYITVSVKKSNVGTTDTVTSFRLQTVELEPDPLSQVLNSTAVLLPRERPPTASEDLDAVLEILTNAFNGAASNRELVEAFSELHRGTSKQSMGRWLKTLQDHGQIETVGKASRTKWRLISSPHAGHEEM